MTKRFLDNIPLLTAILIYYAYCNLFYYYKEFKIDIYNYISNSELLLSFLPTIVVITATIGTYIISYIIGSSTSDRQKAQIKLEDSSQMEAPVKPKKHFLDNQLVIITTFLVIAITLFFLNKYLLKSHHDRRYELREYFLYTSLFTVFSTYLILRGLGGVHIFTKYALIISVALIIFVGKQIGNYRKLEADEIKDGKSNIKLTFKYNVNEIIQTGKDIIFVGQTQSTLFLYKKLDSTVLVYKKEHIDSLVIK